MVLLYIPRDRRCSGFNLDLCRASSWVGPRGPLWTSVLLLLEPAQLVGVTLGGGGTPQQLVTNMEEANNHHWDGQFHGPAASRGGFIISSATSRPAPPGFGGPGDLTHGREGHSTPSRGDTAVPNMCGGTMMVAPRRVHGQGDSSAATDSGLGFQ